MSSSSSLCPLESASFCPLLLTAPNCPEVRGLRGPHPQISPHCLSAAALAVAACSPQAFSLGLCWHQIPWAHLLHPKAPWIPPRASLCYLLSQLKSYTLTSAPMCSLSLAVPLGPRLVFHPLTTCPFLRSTFCSLRLGCFALSLH